MLNNKKCLELLGHHVDIYTITNYDDTIKIPYINTQQFTKYKKISNTADFGFGFLTPEQLYYAKKNMILYG